MTEPLQITQVPVDNLAPNPWNTNRITDPANEERLRTSMIRFGAFKPIIARELGDGSLQIIGGEHRWKVAKQIGLGDVPVINLGRIDERRAKEIGLVDNGRYGDDDVGSLSKLLSELGNDVLTFMPYTEEDLKGLLDLTASIDLDDLDSIDSGPKEPLASVQTAQIVRFKVPLEDLAWITPMIELEMKSGGYKDEDALSNAGHALVSLLNRLRKA